MTLNPISREADNTVASLLFCLCISTKADLLRNQLTKTELLGFRNE